MLEKAIANDDVLVTKGVMSFGHEDLKHYAARVLTIGSASIRIGDTNIRVGTRMEDGKEFLSYRVDGVESTSQYTPDQPALDFLRELYRKVR